MEKLNLTIVEEKNIFIEALRYLNFLKQKDIVHNEDINDYINQMLYNERDEYVDDIDDETIIMTDIAFKDELHAQIVCAFWNAVCADTREKFPEIYDMAFCMYYGVVMALENEKAEGGAF